MHLFFNDDMKMGFEDIRTITHEKCENGFLRHKKQ